MYESMYGNTHVIAEHLAEGLRSQFDVEVVPVEAATPEKVAAVDLLVVGGPTHIHTMSSEKSRVAAKGSGRKAGQRPRARCRRQAKASEDWFHGLPQVRSVAAAFGTRLDATAILTGRASKAIEKRLVRHGYDLVADPESFLVDKQNHLIEGEADRATRWAAELAESLVANP